MDKRTEEIRVAIRKRHLQGSTFSDGPGCAINRALKDALGGEWLNQVIGVTRKEANRSYYYRILSGGNSVIGLPAYGKAAWEEDVRASKKLQDPEAVVREITIGSLTIERLIDRRCGELLVA
jgi:hypothetical protein